MMQFKSRIPLLFKDSFIRQASRRISNQFELNGLRFKLSPSFKQSFRFNSTNASKPVVKPKGIKGLMQVYGYSALVVYIGLSCIDLPLSFLLVHSLGEEKISVYINKVKQLFGYGKEEAELINDVRERIKKREEDQVNGQTEQLKLWERLKQSTLLTELLIAYGIHKSLIVLRVPITAAVTPSMSKILSRYGIDFKRKSNKMFQTMSQDAKIRYKNNDPNNFIKTGTSVPKQDKTKGQKWFNGLM
ncbi:hypothetical protein Kpol_1026p7 [Vanderwaltozyma polyspora DSM 70294]|uniref:DUF1279 domain-containing protein n=1 Tax=Vanderwaltozyma polyspora (strain ATCC 22028 / DSM 70294 / BCRC 21397 / CBS 2163 / NBRC 10782 / NRRL Y-8283 / UCD 57-17) TaxID=436907 RepID=A7TNH8_VANPO|nr:uncharacterized protein Kpol_1026p7 [Vanderwaltozyma polyspora DSM 70294]EDO16161.1 hypothetical protein Kpol_1026p7 [Vanderwaltozyma polyspora DSM 70294]